VRPLLTMELLSEPDVSLARQRAREVADALGLERQDQVRVAAAVSEVARDLLAAGGGRVDFSGATDTSLAVVLTARRAGALPGTGTSAARRLLDAVTVDDDEGGRPVVTLTKALPRAAASSPRELRSRLEAVRPAGPLEELQTRNTELITALEDLEGKRDELARLNVELEDTNRGVVALYADLDRRGQQLQQANEAKTRFLASVSHELRTPVNSVLGLARLLLDPAAEPLSGEQRHQVDLVRSSAEDLLHLVNDLLDLAKAESGRIDPELEQVELGALLADLAATLAPLVASDVALLVEPPDPDVPRWVRTDPGLLRHVLRNLLTNAIKFTERGHVRLATHLVGHRLLFEVSDTGLGIAEADQTRVFEEFYQVRSPLQARLRGTGLGLPYARRLTLLLGGELRLDSRLDTGSTFTVDLPVGPETGRGTGEESGRGDRAGEDRSPTDAAGDGAPALAEALVVDDDPVFRDLLRRELRGLVGHVVEASDGAEGLARMREHAPDVLFLDLRMPHVDGAAVLTAMATEGALAVLPVVLLTSADLSSADPVGARVRATLAKSGVDRHVLRRILRELTAGERP